MSARTSPALASKRTTVSVDAALARWQCSRKRAGSTGGLVHNSTSICAASTSAQRSVSTPLAVAPACSTMIS